MEEVSLDQRAHISVMPQEVMHWLRVRPGSVVVDGTLGLAGHSILIAEALGSQGHLIGIDKDKTSLTEAKKRLASCSLRVDLLEGSFGDVERFLAEVKIKAVDGVLLDLGISSFQLDDETRGFSFLKDGPLDMRMDQSKGLTAADLVNTLKEEELVRIIEEYGEDRLARRIAKAIVWRRAEERILTTGQLAKIVLRSLPASYQRGRIHPATRTFQALRIVVNQELEYLKDALTHWFEALNPQGRMCVIAFHSLEDRIVKQTFKALAEDGRGQILTKKPLEPTQAECQVNARSRSAKLRVIERVS
ncbi:MAG: 16S rRNA (cytosine(1402)-N(4))-methyltransferase RsmH [Candidatus Omnitrophica bacterium]|nr:16S rRNA (cytosine(1402)-N(4))-methyltransferase RsmH [Candidatus Omnitrophota bacterium]